VHIRGFGTFTFNKRRRPATAPARDAGARDAGGSARVLGGAGDWGAQTCANFEIRPLFKVDESVQRLCKVREVAEVPRIPRFSGSIYEAVPTAMYLNPVTVASRCGRSPRLVRAVIDDFFTCVADLVRATVPQVIRLDFGFGSYNFDTDTRACVFKFTPAFRRALDGLNAAARSDNLHRCARSHAMDFFFFSFFFFFFFFIIFFFFRFQYFFPTAFNSQMPPAFLFQLRSSYDQHIALHPDLALQTTRKLRTPTQHRLTPVNGRASTDPALGLSMTGLFDPRWSRGVPLDRELPQLVSAKAVCHFLAFFFSGMQTLYTHT
jgi:hypothetical protein